jgi:exosortase
MVVWAWLSSVIEPADHKRVRRLLVLPFVAFPWITLDLQPVGWWFRLSGAWATEHLLAGAGLHVTREGTHMLVQGMPVSVDVSCSGLKVLQSLVVAGTLLAYSLLGTSKRYWWNVILLLPLAWLANTARIMTISLAAMTFGPEFAMGLFHSWGGLMVLVLMFLVSWGIFRFQVPEAKGMAL